MLWRHLRAIAVLPLVMTVVVPSLLLRLPHAVAACALPAGAGTAAYTVGALALAVGLSLMIATIRLFDRDGGGTLAPWDPTRRLVVRGPYRYVRNPMISGVLLVLLAEAALWQSPAILAWFALFFAANAVYIPWFEEAGLERRFGQEYLAYRRAVPRWLPRLRPWTPT